MKLASLLLEVVGLGLIVLAGVMVAPAVGVFIAGLFALGVGIAVDRGDS